MEQHNMVKRIIFILTMLFAQQVFCISAVFVSFSMPERLLDEIFKDASNHDVPVYLNGLIDDDMQKTLGHLFKFSQKYPNLSVQIDPYAFKKYHINKVPALVVDNGRAFDVLYGNVSIADGLLWIKRKGETQ